MAIQQRPNMENIWAALGGVAIPSQEKILEGWIEEIPLNIIANWIEQRQDKALLYLMQQGIADWGSATDYPKNCFTKLNGVVYISKNPSVGVSPDTEDNTAWAVAFDEYGAAKVVRDIVDELISVEGKLPLYVSKTNPVMDGDAQAPSFVADTGVPATLAGENHVGFTFKDEDNTGLFKDSSGVLTVYKAGNLLARFNPTPTTQNDKDVVTVSMLKEMMQRYELPVGTSLVTNRSENPANYLGYGTWVQDCLGKAIVGVTNDNTSNSPDWAKQVDNQYGEYEHKLSIDEMPMHNHPDALFNGSGVWNSVKEMVVETSYSQGDVIRYGNRAVPDWTSDSGTLADNRWLTLKPNVNAAGGDKAHNNVQPSQTKYIFTRTA